MQEEADKLTGSLRHIKDPEKWQEATNDALRQAAQDKKKNKVYMQPAEASWLEFLEYRGWTPLDVDMLPDDYLRVEWGRYSLMLQYDIPLPLRRG